MNYGKEYANHGQQQMHSKSALKHPLLWIFTRKKPCESLGNKQRKVYLKVIWHRQQKVIRQWQAWLVAG
jgi:hypothetical protein